MASKQLILLGTHDLYVYSVVFDRTEKTFELVHKTELTRDPSWLTRHPYVGAFVCALPS